MPSRSAAYAPSSESVPGTPARFAAASSRMQRFTVPAMIIAIETSHWVARRSRFVLIPRSCARSGRGAASESCRWSFGAALGAGVARRDGGRGRSGGRGECRGHAAGGEPVARQRGVRVDRVRHDRGAEDGCREQHRPRAVEARHQAADDRAGFRRRDDDAEGEADRDDHEQADDHELEGARSALGLEEQQRDRDRSGDHSAPQQGQVEQQVERDRPADHLGDVGRHRDELGLQPERAPAPPAADAVAQGLGEAAPGDDPELGREVLDEPGHHVAEHDDPDQEVAVHGARGHVARDVARVEVRDPGDQGGADQPRETRGTTGAGPRGGRGLRRAPRAVQIEAPSPRDFSAYRKRSGRARRSGGSGERASEHSRIGRVAAARPGPR